MGRKKHTSRNNHVRAKEAKITLSDRYDENGNLVQPLTYTPKLMRLKPSRKRCKLNR